MFNRKKNEDEDEIVSYQINDDFVSGEDIDWDNYIDSTNTKKRKKEKQKRETKEKIKSATSHNERVSEEINYNFQNDESKENPNKNKIGIKVFIGILIYTIFVCFGGFITTYDVNNNPQVVSPSLREKRAAYKDIEARYQNLYSIINQINDLDNSLQSASASDSFDYAIKYKNLTTNITEDKKNVNSITYPDEYKFMQEIAVSIDESVSQYLVLMSNGMSAQNSDYINEAATYKEKYQSQFAKYSDNMEQFKKNVQLEN